MNTRCWSKPVDPIISTRHWSRPMDLIMNTRHWSRPMDRIMNTRHWSRPMDRIMNTRHWSRPMDRIMNTRHWSRPVDPIMSTRHWTRPMDRIMNVNDIGIDFPQVVSGALLQPKICMVPWQRTSALQAASTVSGFASAFERSLSVFTVRVLIAREVQAFVDICQTQFIVFTLHDYTVQWICRRIRMN